MFGHSNYVCPEKIVVALICDMTGIQSITNLFITCEQMVISWTIINGLVRRTTAYLLPRTKFWTTFREESALLRRNLDE